MRAQWPDFSSIVWYAALFAAANIRPKMCSATTPAVRPGWLLTTTPSSDATASSMLSVPMEHTDMRRSFGSERSTSSRHVTAPRVLMITSASLARSIFSSSVGRSVCTITSPNGASRSRWGEPWICIGSSPGTTMVNRPSKLIPFSASAPFRRKSPVGRLSPHPPESQGRRFPLTWPNISAIILSCSAIQFPGHPCAPHAANCSFL